MIAPGSIRRGSPSVAQTRLVDLTDALTDDAAMVLSDALDGATGKRIERAGVPGAGVYYLSRATNGGDSNPLFRVAAVFVLMKRLGMGRERALQVLGWLHEIVDWLWPAEEAGPVADVLDADAELDGHDDLARQRAARGCTASARELVRVKRRQIHSATLTIAVVGAWLAAEEGR